MASTLILPGEHIPRTILPESAGHERPVRLGPGIRQVTKKTETDLEINLVAGSAGALVVDYKKRAVWIDHGHGRVSRSWKCLLV